MSLSKAKAWNPGCLYYGRATMLHSRAGSSWNRFATENREKRAKRTTVKSRQRMADIAIPRLVDRYRSFVQPRCRTFGATVWSVVDTPCPSVSLRHCREIKMTGCLWQRLWPTSVSNQQWEGLLSLTWRNYGVLGTLKFENLIDHGVSSPKNPIEIMMWQVCKSDKS